MGRRVPPFSVYYRTGGNLYHQLRGAGAEMREIPVASGVELSAQMDGWYDELAASFGGNVEERVTLRMAPQLGITEALGCKSLGSLMGKPTQAGFYGYVGLRVLLPDSP